MSAFQFTLPKPIHIPKPISLLKLTLWILLHHTLQPWHKPHGTWGITRKCHLLQTEELIQTGRSGGHSNSVIPLSCLLRFPERRSWDWHLPVFLYPTIFCKHIAMTKAGNGHFCFLDTLLKITLHYHIVFSFLRSREFLGNKRGNSQLLEPRRYTTVLPPNCNMYHNFATYVQSSWFWGCSRSVQPWLLAL